MKGGQFLQIENGLLKDGLGRVIASISSELGDQTIHDYVHAFAASHELLAAMESFLAPVIAAFEAEEKRASSEGLTISYGTTHYRSLPEWAQRGVRAVALARGENVTWHKDKMATRTNLRPLSVEGNVLIDDFGQVVATISNDLGKELSSYANLFAASVELLDIIDFKSGEELAEIKRAFEFGREFSKHENLPANVTVLGELPPLIPDKLRATRQLVARAKRKEYKDWE